MAWKHHPHHTRLLSWECSCWPGSGLLPKSPYVSLQPHPWRAATCTMQPPLPSRPSEHTNNCCCCYCYCKSLAARCCTQPPVHVHHQLPYIYRCSNVQLLIRHLAKQRGPCAGHSISCATCLLLMGATVAHCCCKCSCYCKLKTELQQHQSLQQEHYRSSDSSSSSHVELLRLRFGSQTWYKLCCCWLMLSSCPSGAQTDSRTFIGEKVRIAET